MEPKTIIFFIVVLKKVLEFFSYFNILIKKFHMKLKIIIKKLESKEEINSKNLFEK
jgi:hypothetical protein